MADEADEADEADVRALLARLHAAMNRHALDDFVACFDEAYDSEQQAHPDRRFVGREQVRRNWAEMFAGIPDFRAEVLREAVSGDEAWVEWRWTGTRADGARFEVCGVAIFGVAGGRLRWARLYVEPVEESGAGIAAAVRTLSGGEGA